MHWVSLCFHYSTFRLACQEVFLKFFGSFLTVAFRRFKNRFPLTSVPIISCLAEFVKRFFRFFSKSFWKPFGVPLLTSVNSIPPQAPEVKNFLLKSCTISGDPRHDFLCSLPIDFLLAVVYNENSARCVRQRAAEEGIVHFDEKKKRGNAPLSSSTYPKTRTDFRPCPEM